MLNLPINKSTIDRAKLSSVKYGFDSLSSFKASFFAEMSASQKSLIIFWS